ncbi:CAP domain-containing protein [Streptomyces sp. AM 4-1-1]|uniref:CAP domain-containing protein n=1 Tax=Streptomyces sp. AM 4-1-1 TaxID=3028710 RepID=UPI0023B974F5|nr:CAP domain-containing protein [Streptomyces sp. AM 4-1-1]WEH37657.1 CAP domain-containing protein [Streptomyces sp. AM 4-1-1]
MGRHRRSAEGSPAHPVRDDGTDEASRPQDRGARRRKRAAVPVRSGLLGASAAMAVGAVAVASGLLPGGDIYAMGGAPADQVRSQDSGDLDAQGGSQDRPSTGRGPDGASASRGNERTGAPTRSASGTPAAPSASVGARSGTEGSPKASTAPSATAGEGAGAPVGTATPSQPARTPTPQAFAPPADSAPQAAVLALVNQERAKAGCDPVHANAALASLAQAFSEDMAARNFFDHTDPDGATPWDRATKAGVRGLGGENIARGQADAQTVMNSWMASEGHRANILNCDYKTLGVGVHFGTGGPWWTQDFGF